jgi:hypothetical protein
MAMTKSEAAKLTNDVMIRGVIETVVSESSILQMLPFEDVTGTAITYNRENAAPSVDWYAVGDSWTESTPTFSQVTAGLRILGGDADVDNFLQQTYRNPNDLEAEVISLKAKAVAYEFSLGAGAGDGHKRRRAHPRQAGRTDRHDQARPARRALHGQADAPQALQPSAGVGQPPRNRCRCLRPARTLLRRHSDPHR